MLSRADVEVFALKLVGGSAESLHARIKQMQRSNFPFVVNVEGSGRTRSLYDIDAVMLVGVALALAKLGISVTRAMEITRDGLFAIREAYSDVGATDLGLADAAPRPKRWLLVEQFDLDGRERARFDVVEQQIPTVALETISAGAIIINVHAIWNAMIDVTSRRHHSLTTQLTRVRQAVASGAVEADGDLSAFLKEVS